MTRSPEKQRPPVAQPQTEHKWSDYSQWLVQIEQQAFMPLIDKRREELEVSKTEQFILTRERWDGLNVYLRWHDKSGISRGVLAEIDGEGLEESPKRLELPVYATAAKTNTGEPYGLVVKRRVEKVANFVLPLAEEQLQQVKEAVQKAYAHASTWTESDLEQITDHKSSKR